jgi:hypothetical protein
MQVTAAIKQRHDGDDGELRIHVNTVWHGNGIDRKEGLGFILSGTNSGMALARRLKRAINDGAVFIDPEIHTDIYGHTYVHADCKVMGRRMNADLTRLGY